MLDAALMMADNRMCVNKFRSGTRLLDNCDIQPNDFQA